MKRQISTLKEYDARAFCPKCKKNVMFTMSGSGRKGWDEKEHGFLFSKGKAVKPIKESRYNTVKSRVHKLVDQLIDELNPYSESFKKKLFEQIEAELLAEAKKKGGPLAKLGDPVKKGWMDKCISAMSGKVDDAGAYCANMKDQAAGTTFWRGKGKTKIGPVAKKEGEELIEQEPIEKAKPTKEKEGGAKDKWTVADFKEQIPEWKKAHGGKYDEKKLQAAIDKATEIAKKSTESAPGKATRAEVLGIMQRFFQKESLEEQAQHVKVGGKTVNVRIKSGPHKGKVGKLLAGGPGFQKGTAQVRIGGKEVVRMSTKDLEPVKEDAVDECVGADTKKKKKAIESAIIKTDSGRKIEVPLLAVSDDFVAVEIAGMTKMVKKVNVVSMEELPAESEAVEEAFTDAKGQPLKTGDFVYINKGGFGKAKITGVKGGNFSFKTAPKKMGGKMVTMTGKQASYSGYITKVKEHEEIEEGVKTRWDWKAGQKFLLKDGRKVEIEAGKGELLTLKDDKGKTFQMPAGTLDNRVKYRLKESALEEGIRFNAKSFEMKPGKFKIAQVVKTPARFIKALPGKTIDPKEKKEFVDTIKDWLSDGWYDIEAPSKNKTEMIPLAR